MKTFKKFGIVFLLITALSCSSSKGVDDCEVCSYTKTSGETDATVAVNDGTYNLTMHFPTSDSPYPEGTKATFTISNNELKVAIEGKDCIIIKNPVLTTSGSLEVRFKDSCRDEISYDVSTAGNGALNEINISTLSGTWLGQFNDR